MHRTIAVAAAAALLSTFTLLPAAPAMAAPALPCASGTPLPGDYDGDGHPDELIGVTTGTGSAARTAFQATPSGGGAPLLQLDGQDVASADLNGDTCDDVVFRHVAPGLDPQATIMFGGPDGLDPTSSKTLGLVSGHESDPGSPGVVAAASVVGTRHHGIIQVVVAGVWAQGLNPSQPFLDVFTLDGSGVPGTPAAIDLTPLGGVWGVSLAASGGTVAVGVPFLDVAGKDSAGGVFMFSADASAPATLIYRTTLTQNSPRVPGAAERRDFFGIAVSMRDGRLAIGSEESIGKARSTGSVQPILWDEATSTYTAYRSIQQSTRGVPGTNESDDVFGYRVVVTRGLTAADSYDLAIAAQERVGRKDFAGSVTVANFSKPIYRGYTQDTKGVPGTVETKDWFGDAIGVLRTSATTDTLLIGAPSEHSGTKQPGYVIRSNGKALASSKWTTVAPPTSPTTPYQRWGQGFAG